MARREYTATNMRTGDVRVYVFDPDSSLTPSQDAAINAHAQELGDYNTWSYGNRYAAEMGHSFAFCGDWAVRLPRAI